MWVWEWYLWGYLLMRVVGVQIQGEVLVLYVYQLKTDSNGVENVAVEKVSFTKGGVSSS